MKGAFLLVLFYHLLTPVVFAWQKPTDDIDSTDVEIFFRQNADFESVRRQTLNFYGGRNFSLAWFEHNVPTQHASLLVNVIENLEQYGVGGAPIRYNLRDSLFELEADAGGEAVGRRQRFDITLTAHFFRFFPRLWNGQLDPGSDEEIEWYVSNGKLSYGTMLDSILNDSDRGNPFIDYRKFHQGFFALKKALDRYRKISNNNGWKELDRQLLQKGDTGKWVAALGERLIVTGDLAEDEISDRFDKRMVNAVKHFQMRHGLVEDGIAGPKTISALNVPVQERLEQILINMERWRWVQPLTDARYVLVNIPEFRLYMFEKGEVTGQMPVIVGKEASHTVVFNDKIKYVVVNPYWNIPRSIAAGEMLPRIKADSLYLKTRHIEVAVNGNYHETTADTINWEKVNEENFNVKFRQTPGRHNQLGTIKFIFPNKYSIYLHDTPAKHLFREKHRDLSHGCVRVAEPYRLADWLLRPKGNWSKKKIEKMVDDGKEEDVWITLEEPVPVYILYFTAWVDADGDVHFRDDIYGHDKAMVGRLFSRASPQSRAR